jgi:hypothetical protein
MKDKRSTGWQARVLDDVRAAVGSDPYWGPRLLTPTSSFHLAVFVEPFLQYMLDGKKTVESRFSKNLCAPHKRVRKGDVILLKRSGGAVVGLCQVSAVWFYTLDPVSLRTIRDEYANALCAASKEFWRDRRGMSYATLMQVSHVSAIGPVACKKQDRRGWVVLTGPDMMGRLLQELER